MFIVEKNYKKLFSNLLINYLDGTPSISISYESDSIKDSDFDWDALSDLKALKKSCWWLKSN